MKVKSLRFTFMVKVQNYTVKGAPDDDGAVCKRLADRLVTTGKDRASLRDLSDAMQKHF